MVNADPKRTPTFTMFGNPDFFFQTSTLAARRNESASTRASPGTTATCRTRSRTPGLGMSARASTSDGVDSTTWTDHADIRPTIMSLVGLKDDYIDDGRVVTEILGKGRAHDDDLKRVLNARARATTTQRPVDALGAAYKQVNAPFGQFALDTLSASTSGAESPRPDDDLKYDSIETQIANLTVERDALAGDIRAALNERAGEDRREPGA